MRTEQEIKQHLSDLEACDGFPCGCAGTEHAFECQMGRRFMLVAKDVLRWVLGGETMTPLVERMRADVAKAREQ